MRSDGPALRPVVCALTTALLAVVAAGCDVFDPNLYVQRGDAGGADVGTDAAATLVLQNRCTDPAPVVTVGATNIRVFSIDTTALTNQFNDLTACTGYSEPGNEGFLAVDMVQGEIWHFHAKPLVPTADPALYVLPACDERSCPPGAGLDQCGPGRDEHLSFVAPSTQRFFVGIDSRTTGGSTYQLTVVRPVCGNRILEHSESCDDGNTVSGDGCDAHCHAELSATPAHEVEPNDDTVGANVVRMTGGAGTMTVGGTLGGRCDYDSYALAVPQGGAVRATMLDASGNACAQGTPALKVLFVRPDGRTVGGTHQTLANSACPALGTADAFSQHLDAGTYYVRVTTDGDLPMVWSYTLRLEVAAM